MLGKALQHQWVQPVPTLSPSPEHRVGKQMGKPWPGHLWSEKLLGHAPKDKTRSIFSSVMLGTLPSRACSNSTSPRWAQLCHCSVSLGGQEHKHPKAFPNKQSVCPISALERLSKGSCFPHSKIKLGAGQGRHRDGAACGAELLPRPPSRGRHGCRPTASAPFFLSNIFHTLLPRKLRELPPALSGERSPSREHSLHTQRDTGG